MADHLPHDEREFLSLYRKMKAGKDAPLPHLSEREFDAWAKREGGLSAKATRDRVKATIRRVAGIWTDTQPQKGRRWALYDGPRVILTSTVNDARTSWALHFEDLVDTKGAGGPTIRRHREAVTHYLRAAGSEWAPTKSKLEQRSISARARRSADIQLPEDFVDLVRQIVNEVDYHKDPAVREMYRHRARLNFFTAPRCPSEDSRLRMSNVRPHAESLTYLVSKLGIEEREPVLIPREVFGLAPHVLTWPNRRSYASWVTKWRPKLIARAELRYSTEIAKHDVVWVHADGLPTDPEHYRKEFATHAKTVWPDFYPYMVREVGIIMRGLEIVQERGTLDVEILSQWSDHAKWDNLRRYTRKGRSLLREYEPGPELDELLHQWRTI